jgi:acetolactate synthase-1/2/3 large subunit
MARLIGELQGVIPEDGLLVVDGGFAAHWTGLLYDTQRAGRSYIANRGFASIGFGLPGTLGAQLGAPDAPVVGLTGDAGFNMVLGELETARRLGLGFTLAIVNNAASGYVKALQHNMYGQGNYQSSDLSETNYANVAEALGCQGIRVEDPAELGAAFAAGIAERDRPTIIDVVVTRDPSKMLPGVDSRTMEIKKGDRPA